MLWVGDKEGKLREDTFTLAGGKARAAGRQGKKFEKAKKVLISLQQKKDEWKDWEKKGRGGVLCVQIWCRHRLALAGLLTEKTSALMGGEPPTGRDPETPKPSLQGVMGDR